MTDENVNSINKKLIIGRIMLCIAMIAACVLAVLYIQTFGNILIVAVAFGAVIMVHEFGHFIVAKASGIQVEAFSIGFPPTLLGIQKTEQGLRIRILPKATGSDKPVPGFTIPCKGKPSDTEYRIGLLPFGGFVKMLGQEDAGAVEKSDNPRSFANKPISIRIAVVAAGVTFNAILAVILLTGVFIKGIELQPAIIGDVTAGSPAQTAGFRAGDRIVEIDGETFLDFSSVMTAAALSDTDQVVKMAVEHLDGTKESLEVISSRPEGAKMKMFGVTTAGTLKITTMMVEEDAQKYFEMTGLRPGDVVKAFNRTEVTDPWQLDELRGKYSDSKSVLTVERTDSKNGQTSMVDVEIPMEIEVTRQKFDGSSELLNVYGMLPRLKITSLSEKLQSDSQIDILTGSDKLEVGDVIVKIGDVDNPSYEELRAQTEKHADEQMEIVVLRADDQGQQAQVNVTVIPEKDLDGRVVIGIGAALDTDRPVVAKTLDVTGDAGVLAIPAGATIEAIDGEPIEDFFDVIRLIRSNQGKHVGVDYRLSDELAGIAVLNIPKDNDHITAQTIFAVPMMFGPMVETYKADSVGMAMVMGFKKAKMFILQSFSTIRGLLKKDVSPKTLTGPLGILRMTYTLAASKSFIELVFFMGLINCALAVMNLLPLPIVDGGVIILLIIEKIKGSPIKEKTQEVISYVGLVLIISLFIWLMYNDIVTWVRPG